MVPDRMPIAATRRREFMGSASDDAASVILAVRLLLIDLVDKIARFIANAYKIGVVDLNATPSGIGDEHFK